VYFYFSLDSILIATINIGFVFVYALSLLFSYLGKYRAAKVWLFISFMCHAFILSTQIFTNASGFHLAENLRTLIEQASIDLKTEAQQSLLPVLVWPNLIYQSTY